MLTGTVQWTAQERVIHGKPAVGAGRGRSRGDTQACGMRPTNAVFSGLYPVGHWNLGGLDCHLSTSTVARALNLGHE